MPLAPDATLEYLVTRCRWSRSYIPDVFANMDNLKGNCQVRLAVDGKTMAPDYRIELFTGVRAEPLAIVDGIHHKGAPVRGNDGRVWSTAAMTWNEVGALVERVRGMAPKLVKVVDEATSSEPEGRIMKTVFLLMAQYDGAAIIPVASVVKDYFPHLTVESFVRKATQGEINIPVIYIERSQKTARGVHVQDLADYIEARRKVAKSEMEAFLR